MKNNLSRMDYFEKKYTPAIYRAIRSQIRAFTTEMKAKGVNAAMNKMDYLLINTNVYEAVKRIYKQVGVLYANETYKSIEAQVPKKQFGFNSEWLNEIINFFNTYLLNQATLPITETTKKFIRQILIEGEQQGWGVDLMARKMLEVDVPIADQITMHRARLITRTEAGKAAFKGREVAKQKTPYKLTTEWIAANDHRTRHSHYVMDGVTVIEGERFSVPKYKRIGKVYIQAGVDLMLGPGDPQGSKENVINCRCTTAERVIFDKDKNPIMKQKNVFV